VAAYKAGRLAAAEAAYKRLVAINPRDAEDLHSLGQVLHDCGQLAEAQDALERAIEIEPERPATHHLLGVVLFDRCHVFEAAKAFQRAISLDVSRPDSYYELGRSLFRLGQDADSQSAYKKALEINGNYTPAAWALALSLPHIYESEKEIEESRTNWIQGLEEISQQLSLDTPDAIEYAVAAANSVTNFFLHYQRYDDVQLQQRFGALLQRVAVAKYPKAKRLRDASQGHSARLRVGFVSAHFRFHSVMKTHGRWVTNLDRNRFEVHVFHITGLTDGTGTTDAIRRGADSYFCTTRTDLLIDEIVARQLDALIYLDLGMDPRANIPASLRLARVQCLAGGHPVTSGLPTIDYFLSNDLMEPPGGETHYSERLVRLPNLGGSYPRPPIVSAENRSSNTKPIYLCSQSLFKLLPQYDSIFPEIAQRVGECEFWFLEGPMRPVAEIFEKRLFAAFARYNLDAERYCQIYPPLGYFDFLSLNQQADVFLDSICWSGHNSALEAVACGLPIVTLPGATMRSRHCYGILKRLGVTSTIAQDLDQYYEIAARLGTDVDFHEEVREAMLSSTHELFDDEAPIRALADFLESACRGQITTTRSSLHRDHGGPFVR
jgi:protein O-GlcNAc transferase